MLIKSNCFCHFAYYARTIIVNTIEVLFVISISVKTGLVICNNILCSKLQIDQKLTQSTLNPTTMIAEMHSATPRLQPIWYLQNPSTQVTIHPMESIEKNANRMLLVAKRRTKNAVGNEIQQYDNSKTKTNSRYLEMWNLGNRHKI